MASKKRRRKRKTKQRGGAGKESDVRQRGTPRVVDFLEKIGGRQTHTPARGLLGNLRREDLVAAGRLDPDENQARPLQSDATGAEAPPRHDDAPSRARFPEDPKADGPNPATDRTVVHVEVSHPGLAPPDGRREERALLSETVQIHSVFGPGPPSKVANVSRGGIFIETARPLEVGDPVQLSFSGGAAGQLRVSGRVRWVTPFGGLKDARAGMGIEFVGLDADRRGRLDALLARLPRLDEENPRE